MAPDVARCWRCLIPSVDGLLCPACMATLGVCRAVVSAHAERLVGFGGAVRVVTVHPYSALLRATEPARMEARVARRRTREETR